MSLEVDNMKQNLGKLDRILRFVFGIWAIQFVLPTLKNELLWWVVLVLALIALLESFTSYCLIGISNKNQ